MAESHKLAVVVHHNNEVTVKDERGYPHVCRDCRYSGWLTGYEDRHWPEPPTCLHASGGADPIDGDRVIFGGVGVRPGLYQQPRNRRDHQDCEKDWRERYPSCWKKNQHGDCEDYVKAKPLPWWGNLWRKLLGREWRTRRMRL